MKSVFRSLSVPSRADVLHLPERVEWAKQLLMKLKTSGEMVEEDDLDRIIKVLQSGYARPEFLDVLEAAADRDDSESNDETAQEEPEQLTLKWLAHTYSSRPRSNSVISIRSRMSSTEDGMDQLHLCSNNNNSQLLSNVLSLSPTSLMAERMSSSAASSLCLDDHLLSTSKAALELERYDPQEFPIPPSMLKEEEANENNNNNNTDDIEKQLTACLARFDEWDFDVFELNRITRGRPLLFATWTALHRHHCFETFGFDKKKMRSLLIAIERTYIPDNPYHNAVHAADVVQTVHFFLSKSEILSRSLSPLEVLSMIIAAAGHDVGHNGLNNAFHINTSSRLAVNYNDRSVLENFHAATLFSLASAKEEFQVFDSLNREDFAAFRKLVIGLILGTDMTGHFASVSNLQVKMDVNGDDISKWDNRDLVLDAILHAADISNPVKPRKMAVEWADRCLKEFWNQGDKEKSLGLSISPMCDRATTSRPQSQIGFITFVVKPFFVLLSKIIAPMEICVENANKNLEFWEEQKAAAAAAAAAAASVAAEESERK